MSSGEALCESLPNDILDVISSFLPLEIHGKLDCCSSGFLESGFTWDKITHICLDTGSLEALPRLLSHHAGVISVTIETEDTEKLLPLLISVAAQLHHLRFVHRDAEADEFAEIFNGLDAKRLKSLEFHAWTAGRAPIHAALERLLPTLSAVAVQLDWDAPANASAIQLVQKNCTVGTLKSLVLNFGYGDLPNVNKPLGVLTRQVIQKFHGQLDYFDLMVASCDLVRFFPQKELALADFFNYEVMDQQTRAIFGVPLDRFNSKLHRIGIQLRRTVSCDPFLIGTRRLSVSHGDLYLPLPRDKYSRAFENMGAFFEQLYFVSGVLAHPQRCLRAMKSVFFDFDTANHPWMLTTLADPIARALNQSILYESSDLNRPLIKVFVRACAAGIDLESSGALSAFKEYVKATAETHDSFLTFLRAVLDMETGLHYLHVFFDDEDWFGELNESVGDPWLLRLCEHPAQLDLIGDFIELFGRATNEYGDNFVRLCWKGNFRGYLRTMDTPDEDFLPITPVDSPDEKDESKYVPIKPLDYYSLIKRNAPAEEFAEAIRASTGLALPNFEEDAQELEFSRDSYFDDVGEILFRDIIRNGRDEAQVREECKIAANIGDPPQWLCKFIAEESSGYITFMEFSEVAEFKRLTMLCEAMLDVIVKEPIRIYREKLQNNKTV